MACRPGSSHFELVDIYGACRHRRLQRAEPVLAPVGESFRERTLAAQAGSHLTLRLQIRRIGRPR